MANSAVIWIIFCTVCIGLVSNCGISTHTEIVQRALANYDNLAYGSGEVLRILRDQSFTSLMADLHQDKNRISSFSRCQIQIFSSDLTYQSFNRALPLRKCFIKAPAICKTSVYVLTEICLQWSKWLGP